MCYNGLVKSAGRPQRLARCQREGQGLLGAETAPNVAELEGLALRLRRRILTMIARAGSGHPGGSLSAVEILCSLYFGQLRHNPAQPQWPDRDRFILSKGHAAPALYAVLAEAGYFPRVWLWSLRRPRSPLQGHPERTRLAGVEMSGGPLGHGLAFGIGVALAGRLDRRDYGVYVLISDGECDAGETWEAAMAARHFNAQHPLTKLCAHPLNNLCAILDRNRYQNDGPTQRIMDSEPLVEKWRAFGWHTLETDGHSFPALLDAFQAAAAYQEGPTIIIAHTVKGKGVKFMEQDPVAWHGKAPPPEKLVEGLADLGIQGLTDADVEVLLRGSPEEVEEAVGRWPLGAGG